MRGERLRRAVPSVTDELLHAELGDDRLVTRLLKIASALSGSPDESFPEAMDAAELEGLYRFVGNEAVEAEAIFEAQAAETAKRCEEARTVLCVHDTSELTFETEVARKGLGYLRGKTQGFLLHVSLAVAADGSRRPLGLLNEIDWTRPKKKRKKKWSEPKESARWLEGVESAGKRLDGRAAVIHVMDREADAYPLLAMMKTKGHRFVVRSAYAYRNVTHDGDMLRLRDAIARAEDQIELEVPVSKRRVGRMPSQREKWPARDRRVATVRFSATTVSIWRPEDLPVRKYPGEVELNVAHVHEPNPPEGAEPIEWTLLTSEPIGTRDEVLAIVAHYRARWIVEEFFKALKTGCAFEKRQLRSYHALRVALAIFVPIACRMLHLRALATSTPDQPATLALSELEIRVLRAASSARLPRLPTLREALLAVARLGGHLKNNGEPGWIVLGRGMDELLTLTRGWSLREEVGL